MAKRKSNYLQSSSKYLNDSESLLKKGDYAQASEKIWGAIVTLLKAIAEKKRIRLTTHQGINYFHYYVKKRGKKKFF